MKQEQSTSRPILIVAGWVMPYIAIWLGLFVFRNAWAAVLGYHIGIILLVTIAKAWVPPAQFKPAGLKAVLFGSTGWLAGLAMLALWPVMGVSPSLKTALLDWGLNSRTWLPFILYSTFINPWLEEIYWRNWLGSTHSRPVITDAVFAGFHILILAPFFQPFWLIVAFIVLAASGWMWRQVNRRENSMLASTLFHMSADVSILLAVWSVLGS